ncbi:LppU/SCO3897 family protein [Actinosynnema sp. CS-041913]|uniref:LppU/SCO3897 family protein n=1 Tax=Actinosynnema sp. CS-041913 TaxID=3239917 RepID=UPI003D91EA53
MRKIGWGVGAAVVAIAGGYALTMTGGDAAPPPPAPGDCASVVGQAEQRRYLALDCGAEQAMVKVAKVVDDQAQCPKGAPYSTFHGPVTLCLIPNFVEGACYQQDRDAGLRKADCAAAEAFKVVKAVQGTVKCDDGRTLAYPEPSVTFCLTRTTAPG